MSLTVAFAAVIASTAVMLVVATLAPLLGSKIKMTLSQNVSRNRNRIAPPFARGRHAAPTGKGSSKP